MTSSTQIDASPISRHAASKLWQFMLMALFGVMLASVLCGCGGKDRRPYDAGNNGQTITLERGEPFMLRMLVNIQTGSRWQIVELDSNVVKLRGEPKATGNIVIGGLARIYSYEYMFQPVKEGTTTLKMNLVKPGVEEPLDTFSITLVVKD